MHSDLVDYKIIGNDIQLVEIELDPGETAVAEAGAMLYMEEGIVFETKMGDGSNPKEGFIEKLVSVGSRMISGESIVMTHFTNQSNTKKHVAFSAPYLGTIVPINLKTINGDLIAQKDGFLCAALGTKISVHVNKKHGSVLVGGGRIILQKLIGDGMVFIHSCGSVIEKNLNNETLKIDIGCIVAFESVIEFDLQLSGNLKSMLFGGEAIHLATLKGKGRIWLQSMPMNKLIKALTVSSLNEKK